MRIYKKSLALMLTVMLVLQIMCSFVTVNAQSGLEITLPANGSTISYDTAEFYVNLPSDTVKAIVKLDGTILENADTSGVVTLNDTLVLGKHTLEVAAVYEDGTAEKTSSDFTAAVIPNSATIDFNNITPEEYATIDDARAALLKSLNAVNNVYQDADNYRGKVAVESDGDYGNVLKIKTTTNRMLAGGAYIHIHANPTMAADGTAVNSTVSSGKLGLEFDVCLPVGREAYDPTQLTLTPYEASGKYFGAINLAISNKILNTDTIDPGWFNVSLVFDLDNSLYWGTITDTSAGTSWTITPQGMTTTTNASKLVYYRLGARIDKGTEVAFDNIKTGMVGNYVGADEIWFKDSSDPDADSDGYVNAASKPVGRNVSEMLLKLDNKLAADTVTADNISVVAGGKNIPVTNAVYDEAKGTIALTLNNSGIDTNGDTYVSLSSDIKLKGSTTAVGVASRNPFSLTEEGFRIKSADFKKGTSELLMADQLSTGDKVKAEINFQNFKSSDEKLTAVLAVKSGFKFLSVTPVDISVPSDSSSYSVSVESPALTTADNITATLILVDDLKNALYIDSYDLK